MKAIAELRIGNWVEWNYEESSDGNAYPVEYGYELDYIENNPNIVKPIPLTEEWLGWFGFVKCDKPHYSRGDCYSLDDFYYWTSYSGLVVNGYDPIDEVSIIVKHVHQLQNLYFALTGEELTKKK